MDSNLHPPGTAYGGKGGLIMAITWAEAGIGVALVLARLFGASVRGGELRWDFLWVAIACVLGLSSQSLLSLSVAHGTGNHIWNLTVPDITQSLYWYWTSVSVGLFSILFAKLAIIALMLNIAGPTQKKRAVFLHFLWVSNLILSAALVAMVFLQCTPTARAWDITITTGNCDLKQAAIYLGYAQGAWAAATDIALAIYPAFIVWDLKISLRMKLGFCILMSGGIIAAIAGTMRTVFIRTLASTSDVTYAFSDFMIWAGTELWCIIILGSIPPLRALFVRCFRKARTSNFSLSQYGRSSSRSGGTRVSRSTSNPGGGEKRQMGSKDSGVQVSERRLNINRSRSQTAGLTTSTMGGPDPDDEDDTVLVPKDRIKVQNSISREVEEAEEQRPDGWSYRTWDPDRDLEIGSAY